MEATSKGEGANYEITTLDFPVCLWGCHHSRLSRVFTIERRTYQVCFECGQKFDYSWTLMHPVQPSVGEAVEHCQARRRSSDLNCPKPLNRNSSNDEGPSRTVYEGCPKQQPIVDEAAGHFAYSEMINSEHF